MSIINITVNNFESEVMNSKVPVLLDFCAEWCVPCRMLSRIIDEISREVQNIKICKIDVDEQTRIAEDFGVKSIPTLIVIKGGKIASKAVGARTKQAILYMLK